jgi:hypothetical protein
MAQGQRSWRRARTGNAMRLEASALLAVDGAPRWSQSAPERSALLGSCLTQIVRRHKTKAHIMLAWAPTCFRRLRREQVRHLLCPLPS